jgi:hypothetical protein
MPRWALGLLLVAAACGSGARSATSKRARPAAVVGVALDVVPDTATVIVDDEPRGTAASLGAVLALEPGLHTLVITHEGYQSYRAEFAVTDKTERFVVRLERLH